jgi:acetyl esterase/lipase
VLPALANLLPPAITAEMIPTLRETVAPMCPPAEVLIGDRAVDVEDLTIPGPDGAPDLVVSVLRPRRSTGPTPGVYYTHGGGMVMGGRWFLGTEQLIGWVDSLGVTVVTVEYRLAPEHPDPAPVEDCYAGLVWTAKNAAELGIDPARIVLCGESAGGGLAAGTALLARDRGGPELAGQMLIYPMLDDRNDSFSGAQFAGVGIWDRTSNDTGWTALLGERRGTDAVSCHAAPARATDLSGLPPTFLDVSTTETFRDETLDYADRLWKAGVQAEVHVWPGGPHGFDLVVPTAQISVEARAARIAWLRRINGV